MSYTLSNLYNELDEQFKGFLNDSQDSRCLLNLLRIPGTDLLTQVVQYVLRYYNKSDNVFRINNQALCISLEDVLYLTGLPIAGRVLISDDNRDSEGFNRVFQMGGIKLLSITTLTDIAKNVNEPYDKRKKAILLLIVRCFIVPDSSGSRVPTTYLRFIEDFGQVDSYAWGAALLAFLYYGMGNVVDVESKKKHLDGNSWLILAFFILRIPKLQDALGINLRDVELGVPILSTIVERVTAISHNHRTDYHQQLDDIFPVLGLDDVDWTPYTRVNNEDRIRYQEQQHRVTYVGAIFCNNYVVHHMPHLAAQQFPVLRNYDIETLSWKPMKIKIKHNKGDSAQHLLTHYDYHIKEWNSGLLLQNHMKQLSPPPSPFEHDEDNDDSEEREHDNYGDYHGSEHDEDNGSNELYLEYEGGEGPSGLCLEQQDAMDHDAVEVVDLVTSTEESNNDEPEDDSSAMDHDGVEVVDLVSDNEESGDVDGDEDDNSSSNIESENEDTRRGRGQLRRKRCIKGHDSDVGPSRKGKGKGKM